MGKYNKERNGVKKLSSIIDLREIETKAAFCQAEPLNQHQLPKAEAGLWAL